MDYFIQFGIGGMVFSEDDYPRYENNTDDLLQPIFVIDPWTKTKVKRVALKRDGDEFSVMLNSTAFYDANSCLPYISEYKVTDSHGNTVLLKGELSSIGDSLTFSVKLDLDQEAARMKKFVAETTVDDWGCARPTFHMGTQNTSGQLKYLFPLKGKRVRVTLEVLD